jgi:hypothetical protein
MARMVPGDPIAAVKVHPKSGRLISGLERLPKVFPFKHLRFREEYV